MPARFTTADQRSNSDCSTDGKLLGRARRDVPSLRDEIIRDLRNAQCPFHVRMQLAHDVRRQACRTEQAVPGSGFESRIAGLGDRRNVRQQGQTLRSGCRKCAKIVRPDLRHGVDRVVEHRRHLAGDQIGARRRRAAIGDMDQVDAGGLRKQHRREMRRRPQAGVRDRQVHPACFSRRRRIPSPTSRERTGARPAPACTTQLPRPA